MMWSKNCSEDQNKTILWSDRARTWKFREIQVNQQTIRCQVLAWVQKIWSCLLFIKLYNNIHTDYSLKNKWEKCGGKVLNVFHLKRIILTQKNWNNINCESCLWFVCLLVKPIRPEFIDSGPNWLCRLAGKSQKSKSLFIWGENHLDSCPHILLKCFRGYRWCVFGFLS